jgi:predicted Rossmann fold nucleotide-binding protein DprA/Smf involved in DNA uptake
MPVESAADILDALGLGGGPAKTCEDACTFENPIEAALHGAGLVGLDLDGLAKAVNEPPESLCAALTSLELEGKAQRLAGRYVWVGGKG